jgi:thiosulfate dehydrogenase [quinone] large subunit
MTTTASPRHDKAYRDEAVTLPKAQTPTPPIPDAAPRAGRTAAIVARYAWFAARIGMSFIFLWAFVDKLFGFGYATPAGKGWIDGGNPTKGFLSGAKGPFADFYHNLAGTTFANVAFTVGLAGIGLALLLGIGMRIAAVAGALLLTMMYTVVLPPTTNPVIDDHLILAVLLIGVAAAGAGNTFGLGRWWTGTPLVKRLPWLT